VLGIASVQDVKHGFLFLAVCEFLSCDDNSHGSVAARYNVSRLASISTVSRG
jgi:hypothetical protein